MMLWVPLMQLLVLVFAATFDVREIKLSVVDNDLSQTSRQLASKFDGSGFFKLNNAFQNPVSAEVQLLEGKTDMVLIIPSGFERTLVRENTATVQILIDAMEGNTAQLIYSYALQTIQQFNNKVMAEQVAMPQHKLVPVINVQERFWYNDNLDYKWYMAPGILSVLVTIIGMFMSGLNLVREKELGTIEQLNVTPIKKYQFIVGKLIPFWIIGLIELAFGLTIAWIVFSLPINGSLFLLFCFAGLYLAGILGLGLFLSTLAHTQQQVMFMNFFFMLIFILMGGIFTPVESMPTWAQTINYLNPVYYFMRIMRQVILKGSEFTDLITEFTGLVVLGVFFLSMAIWRYRKTD